MTLLAEIQAKCSAELLATQDHEQMASIVSQGRTKVVPTEIGNGTIIDVLGRATGNAVLDVLNTVADYRYIKPLLEQGRLRLDLAFNDLDALVTASVLTAEQCAAMKALAVQPDPVSAFQVAQAIEGGV